MPPQGRPKVGLKRIDAAIDALVPLGFSEDIVRKTVMKLLKIYDDAAGWVFIEEASYRLVIETILEEQENAVTTNTEGEDFRIDEGLGSMHINERALDVGEMSSGQGVLMEADRPDPDDQQEQHTLSSLQRQQKQEEEGIRGRLNSDAGPSDVQKQTEAAARRRGPCYGWISESDGDEEENHA